MSNIHLRFLKKSYEGREGLLNLLLKRRSPLMYHKTTLYFASITHLLSMEVLLVSFTGVTECRHLLKSTTQILEQRVTFELQLPVGTPKRR